MFPGYARRASSELRMRPKARFLGLFVAVFSAVALAVLVPACGGGDDELSLQEYFDQVVAIREVDEERFAPVGSQLETAFDPDAHEQDRIEALRNGLDQAVAANRAAAEDYGELSPPTEVEEEHNDLVSS